MKRLVKLTAVVALVGAISACSADPNNVEQNQAGVAFTGIAALMALAL